MWLKKLHFPGRFTFFPPLPKNNPTTSPWP
jgi:hypothetical protein